MRGGRFTQEHVQATGRPWFVRALTWPVYAVLTLATLAFAIAAGAIVLLKLNEPVLPMNSDLYALNRPASLSFLDRDGRFLGMRGAIVGERLKLADMPAYLPAAFLAKEDRNFYAHRGIDPRGLLRAALADYNAGRIVQGGSTITQQLVKILLLTPDRTIERKITEIAGALELERRLTKNEILELYLNRIYLGAGAYGVDGAARAYFGKSARRVTLPEAAMLAALTTAPSAFSPRRDLRAARKRAEQVLAAMVEFGAISAAEAEEAKKHPASVVAAKPDALGGYFLDAAADEVKLLIKHPTGDLTIRTTLNIALQAAAQDKVRKILETQGRRMAVTQGALVSIAPDGAVLALVGGRDYGESTFDRVTMAHRQPGSSFKPFVYLTALEHGLTPMTVRVDQPITIRNWSPENYGQSHLGPVTLQEALTRSINTIAAQLGQEVGIKNVIAVAHRLGIRSTLQPVPSLALGTSEVTPLELTSAYASFATAGLKVNPYFVTEIARGDDIVFRRSIPPPPRVITSDHALAMNAMLYRVVQAGTGRAAAVPGHEVAGKTGTSADFRDAWFVGFSAEMITGVWVGNDDFSPMRKVTGGSLPAQIWTGFMRTALKNVPPTPLQKYEPPPPEPLIAEDDRRITSDEDFFDRVGGFFGRIFNGEGSAERHRRDPAMSYSNAYNRGGYGYSYSYGGSRLGPLPDRPLPPDRYGRDRYADADVRSRYGYDDGRSGRDRSEDERYGRNLEVDRMRRADRMTERDRYRDRFDDAGRGYGDYPLRRPWRYRYDDR